MAVLFHGLNVGRGDAFFLEFLRSRHTSRIVLVDGGDPGSGKGIYPKAYMGCMGWDTVDLLILSHIHLDHVSGLLPVAEKMRVVEAVLPYPDFAMPETLLTQGKGTSIQRSLEAYHILCRLLKTQGTDIRFRVPFGDQRIWAFENYQLRQIYPLPGDIMPGHDILSFMHSFPETCRLETALEAFDQASNLDCSIWVLEHRYSKEQLLLLPGDAPLSLWEPILHREDLKPRVLKVPHHGKPDGWDTALIESLRPDWVFITNTREEAQKYWGFWQSLAGPVQRGIYTTAECSPAEVLVSCLPSIPQKHCLQKKKII